MGRQSKIFLGRISENSGLKNIWPKEKEIRQLKTRKIVQM